MIGFGNPATPSTLRLRYLRRRPCLRAKGLTIGKPHRVGFSMSDSRIARYRSRHGAARVSKAVTVSSGVPNMPKDGSHPEGFDYSIFADGIRSETIMGGWLPNRPFSYVTPVKNRDGATMLPGDLSSGRYLRAMPMSGHRARQETKSQRPQQDGQTSALIRPVLRAWEPPAAVQRPVTG